MPFPFVLPTTSAFSFSSSFTSETHPSLPLSASTYRGVVRDSLKKHKRLPPAAQQPHVSTIIASLKGYIPYLLAIDSGLARNGPVQVTCTTPPVIEWRPTLSGNLVPGRERARVKVHSLEHEVAFVLSALASADALAARAALQPLYSTSGAPVGSQERGAAISAATKHLLDAASIYGYLAERSERPPLPSEPSAPPRPPPCPDVTPSAIRALGALARAEATLLAVLKDDPYPAAVAQDRNANDREWMYKAPDIPKVRAHLFARLCLVAAEHAAQAHALFLAAGSSTAKGSSHSHQHIDDALTRYAEDLRRSSRAKACRFLGIDAELGDQTGTALAWLNAGLQELGAEPRAGSGADGRKKPSGLGRLKKEWSERREDKKIDRSAGWGADGGRLEEMRVIEMLADKWTKMNDTMNTQVIPPVGPLLAQMPSGREVHTVKPYDVPTLEPHVLEAMRAPPQRSDDYGKDLSSDDEGGRPEAPPPVGSFPGAGEEYRGSPSTYY